jgi:YYY domain-containing protein
LIAALLVGALRATNTWDFPVYILLAAGAVFVGLWPGRTVGWAAAAAIGAGTLGLLFGLSSLLYLPYLTRYELFYSGVVPVRATTDVAQFLTINGLLFVVVGGWLAVELARFVRSRDLSPAPAPLPGAYYSVLAPPLAIAPDLRLALALGLVLLVGAALFAAGRGTVAVILGLGLATAIVALARRASPERLFLLVLIAAALGALLLPELVAVRGDVGRMNTVFKFYLQAWVLLSLAAGPAVVWAIGRLTRGRDVLAGWGRVWLGLLVVLAVAAAVYPLRATPTKLALRFNDLPPTLDGATFMAHARYADEGRDLRLQDDASGIRWMLEHVVGSPVVLEGNAPLYHWGSRFSMFTGLPTVLGWDWHQKQQRWGYQAQVEQRQREVRAAYDSPDIAPLRTLIDKYSVGFIVVGGVERAYYSPLGLAKFEAMVGNGLEVAYRTGELTIYRVAN